MEKKRATKKNAEKKQGNKDNIQRVQPIRKNRKNYISFDCII